MEVLLRCCSELCLLWFLVVDFDWGYLFLFVWLLGFLFFGWICLLELVVGEGCFVIFLFGVVVRMM